MSKCRCIETKIPMVCDRCSGMRDVTRDELELRQRVKELEGEVATLKEKYFHVEPK